jgi:hypothetical protein
VPMTPAGALLDGVGLPTQVEVHVYAGADGDFTLVDDDADGAGLARTRLTWDDATAALTAHEPTGDVTLLPAGRSFVEEVHGSGDDDVEGRVFAVLDRARMEYDVKGAAYDVVRRSSSSLPDALAALHALDLHPSLLGALTELLLAHP